MFTYILDTATNYIILFVSRFIIYPINMARAKSAPIDSEIEEAFAPDDFGIDGSIPSTLTNVFVCLMYSGGMPLLNVLTFLIMIVQYVTDVFFLFRSKKPPVFKSELMTFFLHALPYSVFVHLAISGWMVGYNDIYYISDEMTNFLDKDFFKAVNFWNIMDRVK